MCCFAGYRFPQNCRSMLVLEQLLEGLFCCVSMHEMFCACFGLAQ